MLRWLRFSSLVPILFCVAILQYGGTAFSSALKGNVALWQLDSSTLDESGALRYLKDGFLLIFSVAWPVFLSLRKMPAEVTRLVHGYFVWVLLVSLFGLLGILVEFSPPIFLAAGIRWVMLLHASFGTFLMMRACAEESSRHRRIAAFLFVLAAIDLLLISIQLRSGRALFDLGLGQARLTGLFSNAGVAGFFGFALAITGLHLSGVRSSLRLLLTALSFVIALSSGTRSMVIMVFGVVVLQIIELTESGNPRSSLLRVCKVALFPLLCLSIWVGYRWLIAIVDRGEIFETQLGNGGRIHTFMTMLNTLAGAEPGEFLFGRGLGVGTNTAYSMLATAGKSPDAYRFNWLVDNAFLTQFFQLGLVGSFVFWIGLVCFFCFARPPWVRRYQRRYWLTVGCFSLVIWAGNPFEHYLLMIPMAISFGCSYWGSRSAITERNAWRQV